MQVTIAAEHHVDERQKPRGGTRVLDIIAENLLIILLAVAMVMGIAVGFSMRVRPEPYSADEIQRLDFPGELLINMLKLTIIPLIVSSLIAALTSLDTRVAIFVAGQTLGGWVGGWVGRLVQLVLDIFVMKRGTWLRLKSYWGRRWGWREGGLVG